MKIVKNTAALIIVFSFICFSALAVESEQKTIEDWRISQKVEKQIKASEKNLEARLKAHTIDVISTQFFEKYKKNEKSLEEQAKNQFESMKYLFAESKNFISIYVSLAYGIFVILWVVAGYLFWRQGNSLKDVMKKNMEDQLAEFDRQKIEYGNALEDQLAEFQKMRSDYEMVLKENETLSNKLESITAYKNKKIVWAYEDKDATAVSESAKEIKKLRYEGFSVTECEPGEEHILPAEKCDLMIYFYRNTDQAAKRFEEIGKFIQSIDKNIPLIIYTYKCGAKFVDSKHIEGLKDCENYIYSNMPLTLQSHFNSLIRD